MFRNEVHEISIITIDMDSRCLNLVVNDYSIHLEEKMIKDYEEYKLSLVHEEVALSAAIEALSTDEVICPLCQR